MDDIVSHVRQGLSMNVRLWLDNTENDLNQGDDHRFSLLHWACWDGHLSIVDLLLQRGARLNATNMGDDTPLHLAASHGHREVVRRLVAARAPLNPANEHGNTPLHYACFWNHAEIAEDLVNQGALVNVENRYGQTALDVAKQRLARFLRIRARELGQDVDIRQVYRDTSYLGVKTRTRDPTLSRHAGIRFEQLRLQQCVAATHGGETWLGRWQDTEICAKILRLREFTVRHSRDFNEEVSRLRVFNHANLLPVLTVVNQPPQLMLVTQYMPHGSLFDVLHANTGQIMIDANQSLGFAIDIAKGIDFLLNLEGGIPNVMLNSKHIMVDDDLTARINLADHKFSFHEKKKEYNPAWLSPEALQFVAKDLNLQAAYMWSFGVLLWEIETRQVPFADMSPTEIGLKIALENLRVQCGPGMSRHITRLINLALNREPGQRPRFDRVMPILEKMRQQHTVQQEVS